MQASRQLTPEEREELLRRAWYSHDARWFSAVAREFGIEAANRVNREVVREVGRIEAGRLLRASAAQPGESLEAFLDFLRAGLDLYVAPPLMEMTFRKVDEDCYEVSVGECFVASNISRAGIAGSYECAVWDRVAGYHDALGQALEAGQLPGSTCMKATGGSCSRVIRRIPHFDQGGPGGRS